MMRKAAAALAVLLLASPAIAAENPPVLELPIACALGKDCFVQQLPDLDPGPAAKDYRCGGATYDRHDGTDFRLLSAKAAETGVAVLASAPGTIKGVRDGVADRIIASAADRVLVRGIECGNGVVIDHGGGWETQYCHLRRGSVAVRRGQKVETGARLGLVGYSGDAQFAHVHLTVRRDGKTVDPFLGEGASGSCQDTTSPAGGLWSPPARAALIYPDAAIIETGFAAAAVSLEQAELGAIPSASAGSPGLVFFARAINLRQGDALQIRVTGPGGFAVANEVPLDRDKAQYIASAGKKLRAERWPPGDYRGEAAVIRGGRTISQAASAWRLP